MDTDSRTPAQAEEDMLLLTYAIRDSLMGGHGFDEVAATNWAAHIVHDLRVGKAGWTVTFPARVT